MESGVSFAFKDYIQCGLGADLMRITGLLNRCELSQRILYMPADDIWEHTPEASPNRGWTYYFEPSIPIDERNEFPRIILEADKIIVPDDKINLTKFQYRSELLKKIYKPKKEFRDSVMSHIHTYLSELESSDYAMIHIRRGDKVSGPWSECEAIPVDRYLDSLWTWLKSQNRNESDPFNVFIMTDSNEVITEIESKTQQYLEIGVKFIWDKTETRRDGYSYKLHEYGYSDAEKIDEMLTNMKNVWLMEHAKILIGARSSFLFTIGELLNPNQAISLESNTRYPSDL